MAGRPWEERLCLYIQASFSFVLLLTLDAARSFASADARLADTADILVVEIVLALAFYARGRVGVLLPILIGPVVRRGGGGGSGGDAAGGAPGEAAPASGAGAGGGGGADERSCYSASSFVARGGSARRALSSSLRLCPAPCSLRLMPGLGPPPLSAHSLTQHGLLPRTGSLRPPQPQPKPQATSSTTRTSGS